MNHCACNDFERSRRKVALASRMASAGDGLPAIEPGMPAPAGTGLDRRSFLLASAGVALSVYGGRRLGIDAFEEGIAGAAGGPANPVLVSVFLAGGIDALSVLAPVDDPIYQAKRPNLKLAPNPALTFADDTRLQWHPATAALQAMHEAGKVAVMPSIGYDHPDQSHFTSRHYWEVGALDVRANLGWMGRHLDRVGSPDNPLQGLSLDGSLSPALASANVPVAALTNPSDYKFWAGGVGDPVTGEMLDTFGALGAPATDDRALAQARRATRQTDGLRRSLAGFGTVTSTITYPNSSFAKRLKALAKMLADGLPIRCVAIEGAGGYDTHSGQAASLTRDLQATCDALKAFQDDLEARGIADRVLVHVWSEFGRRPQENGSDPVGSGTDHGAGGVGFLIGSRVQRQVVGEWAGLASLDPQGNLRNTSDFRTIYAALLDQWLGDDPAAVIPGADAMTLPQLITP